MCVLDVLKYDIESVETTLKLLNSDSCIGWRLFWPRDFTTADVEEAVRQLLERGLVKPLKDDPKKSLLVDIPLSEVNFSDLSPLWFALTEKGRREWEQWEPPVEED